MKKFSLIVSLLFLTGFLISNQSYAQIPQGAVVAYETSAVISLGNDINLDASNYTFVETSSGNYTVNATFYLTPGNPFIPKKGTNKVDLLGTIVIGFPPLFSIAEATINKHGKCHVVFHVNNSGN